MISYEIITRKEIYKDEEGNLIVDHNRLFTAIIELNERPNPGYLNDVEKSLSEFGKNKEIFTKLKKVYLKCCETSPLDRPDISIGEYL